MAFFPPQFGPQPGQYFVPESPFAGRPMFPGMPYPTYPRYGKVVYKYHTPDGGPPNMGAPPRKPKEGGLGSFWPGGGAGGGGGGFFNPMFASGFGYPSAPPPPPPEAKSHKGNRSSNKKHSYGDDSDTDDKYSSAGRDINIRVFQNNILLNHRTAADGLVTVAGHTKVEPKKFSRETTIRELIEEIDCVTRANYHRSYPRYAIGIQEVFPEGHGRFRAGSKIMLDDTRASLRVGDLWPNATDHASENHIPYIVRLPVCG